jgi:hypothetical protein
MYRRLAAEGMVKDVPVRDYRLVVDGELSDDLGQAFEGMSLSREHGTTVLVGPIRDQAQLHGLLQRFSELGLTLLSVSELERKP